MLQVVREDDLADSVPDPYDKYGTWVPPSVPGSPEEKAKKRLEIGGYTTEFGGALVMVTETGNDDWPERVALSTQGPGAVLDINDEIARITSRPNSKEHKLGRLFDRWKPAEQTATSHFAKSRQERMDCRSSASRHPTHMTLAFQGRKQLMNQHMCSIFQSVVAEEDLVASQSEDEEQSRGQEHTHTLQWFAKSVDSKKLEPLVQSELVRPNSDCMTDDELWMAWLIKLEQLRWMMHTCRAGRCDSIPGIPCKYGFPFAKNNEMRLDPAGMRLLLVTRFEQDDQWLAPTILELLLLYDGHVHILLTANGVANPEYLTKYITKSYNVLDLHICSPSDTAVRCLTCANQTV